MANLLTDQYPDTIGSGSGPFAFDLPIKGTTKVFRGSLVSQITASGFVVPYSTASSSHVIGVSEFAVDNSLGADGDARVRVHTKRAFALTNGAGGDAFSEASIIGSVVFGTDDNTVADNSAAATRKPVGFFMGMESDGKVRVFIDPVIANIANILSSLADSPATADALRDAIVAGIG